MQNSNPLSNNLQLNILYDAIKVAYQRIAYVLRNSSCGGEITDQQNKFGDIQLNTDIQCEDILNEELRKSGVVSYSLSEETPEVLYKLQSKLISLGTGPYIVTFDPLDGSSIIGTNWTVGSIIGIWKNDQNVLIGQRGKDQVGACCCLYGSRTTALFYSDIVDGVLEQTYFENTKVWKETKSKICIKKKASVFAPGNLRAVSENIQYKKLVDFWITNGYTLRYSGGLVPDIYQIFVREQGIFTNMESLKNPAKLRYLYEVAPLAFLVEKAGGSSSDGKQSVLDLEIVNYTQKSSIAVGSEEEIQRLQEIFQQ